VANVYLTLHNADLTGIPGLAPIDGIQSMTVRMEALDESPQHQVVLYGTERTNVAAMVQATAIAPVRVAIHEAGIGILAWGLIATPEHQVDDGGHLITLTMDDITHELAWTTTSLGYARAAEIGQVVTEIGSLPPTGKVTPFVIGGAIAGYTSVDAQSTRVYGTDGALLSTSAGQGPATGWSASFVDQNTIVPSSAPVPWLVDLSGGSIVATGNNLRKLDGQPASLTTAYTALAQYLNHDLVSGAVVNSDCDLTWQAANATSDYLLGLRDATGIGLANLKYSFHVLADGTWQIVEAGVPVAGMSGGYTTNDSFMTRVINTTTTPQVAYYHNNLGIYVSAVTPTFPLSPLALMNLAGSEVANVIMRRSVRPSQVWTGITLTQTGLFDALRQAAKQTLYHVRQGRDAFLNGNRTIEFGPFGALSNLHLIWAGAGDDLDLIAENPDVRVIESIRVTQDRTKLVNTVTPIGGGGNAPLTLERLWKLRYDPQYPNYGKVGNVPGSVFTEFDSNYPVEQQFTRDGRSEYYVRDLAAYAAMGNQEIRGTYNDAQFTTGTNDAPVVQEIAARGLYAAVVSKMIRESKPSWTITVVTDGRGRVPRAGDRLTIDWKEIAADDDGTFIALRPGDVPEMKTPYITAVDRVYDDTGGAHDQWTLSTTGITLDDGTETAADSVAQLDAVTLAVRPGQFYDSITRDGDVDASTSPDHSLIVRFRAPAALFRWTQVSIDCFFRPLRQQVKTASGGLHHHSVQITIPDHDHAPPAGLQTDSAQIGGMPVHVHETAVAGAGISMTVPALNTPFQPDRYLVLSGDGAQNSYLHANGGHSGTILTSSPMTGANLQPTEHPHPVSGVGGKITTPHQFAPISTTTVQTSNDGVHTHDIPTELHDTTSPTLCFLSIDSGDGGFQPVSAALKDTRSGKTGPWSGDFSINDVSKYCGSAGKLLQFKFASGMNSNNGVGNFDVLITFQGELGAAGVGFTIDSFH
jgi:hypothetical protein